jgi:hypothetical protein
VPLYSAYGFVLDSELALEGLHASSSQTATFRLNIGSVHFQPPKTDRVICRPLSEDETIVYFQGVGTALIRQNGELTLEPDVRADPIALQLFVLQQVLGTALLQRGYLVLHSAAVVIEAGAVAFTGNSGQGKSTLTAALNKLGCPILADDVLAIDTQVPGGPMALPGLSQLKLTEETRTQVVPDILTEQPIRDRTSKKLCTIRGTTPQNRVPLRAIFTLETGDEVGIFRVEPARAVIELVRHTYGAELLPHIGRAAGHFQQCAGLVERVPVFLLRRPRDLSLIHSVAMGVVEEVRRLPLS